MHVWVWVLIDLFLAGMSFSLVRLLSNVKYCWLIALMRWSSGLVYVFLSFNLYSFFILSFLSFCYFILFSAYLFTYLLNFYLPALIPSLFFFTDFDLLFCFYFIFGYFAILILLWCWLFSMILISSKECSVILYGLKPKRSINL